MLARESQGGGNGERNKFFDYYKSLLYETDALKDVDIKKIQKSANVFPSSPRRTRGSEMGFFVL